MANNSLKRFQLIHILLHHQVQGKTDKDSRNLFAFESPKVHLLLLLFDELFSHSLNRSYPRVTIFVITCLLLGAGYLFRYSKMFFASFLTFLKVQYSFLSAYNEDEPILLSLYNPNNGMES